MRTTSKIDPPGSEGPRHCQTTFQDGFRTPLGVGPKTIINREKRMERSHHHRVSVLVGRYPSQFDHS